MESDDEVVVTGSRSPPSSIGATLETHWAHNQGHRDQMEDLYQIYQSDEEGYAFYAIFDGHGGDEAALFAQKKLRLNIVGQEEFFSHEEGHVLNAIRNGFLITHQQMAEELPNWPQKLYRPSTAGTTASVAIIRNGKIYLGHVGDSSIVLGLSTTNPWSAIPVTEDHTPFNPKEAEELLKRGGKITRRNGIGPARVAWVRKKMSYNGTPTDEIEEIPFLGMTRSLGNFWSYNPEIDDYIVSPEPQLSVHPISPNVKCLLLASDGVWNVLKREPAIQLTQAISGASKSTNLALGVCRKALQTWNIRGVRADNISVITVLINPPNHPGLNQKIIHNSNLNSPNTVEPIPRTQRHSNDGIELLSPLPKQRSPLPNGILTNIRNPDPISNPRKRRPTPELISLESELELELEPEILEIHEPEPEPEVERTPAKRKKGRGKGGKLNRKAKRVPSKPSKSPTTPKDVKLIAKPAPKVRKASGSSKISIPSVSEPSGAARVTRSSSRPSTSTPSTSSNESPQVPAQVLKRRISKPKKGTPKTKKMASKARKTPATPQVVVKKVAKKKLEPSKVAKKKLVPSKAARKPAVPSKVVKKPTVGGTNRSKGSKGKGSKSTPKGQGKVKVQGTRRNPGRAAKI